MDVLDRWQKAHPPAADAVAKLEEVQTIDHTAAENGRAAQKFKPSSLLYQ